MSLKTRMLGLLAGVVGAFGFSKGLNGKPVEHKEHLYKPSTYQDPSFAPGRRGRRRPRIRSKVTGRAYSPFAIWLLRKHGMNIQSIRSVFGQQGAQWAMAR